MTNVLFVDLMTNVLFVWVFFCEIFLKKQQQQRQAVNKCLTKYKWYLQLKQNLNRKKTNRKSNQK